MADRPAWPKPLDVGNGQVCASFAADGSWLSLGSPHPDHGFVEVAGAEFDESWRGRADLVRAYRRELTRPRRAAVRLVDAPPVAPEGRPGAVLSWTGADDSGRREVTAWAAADEPAVVQRHTISAGRDEVPRRVTVLATACLLRPAYAEITDVSPLPPGPRRQELSADGSTLWVSAPELPARAALRVSVTGGTWLGWEVDGHTARLVVTWTPGRDTPLVILLAWSLGPTAAADPAPPVRTNGARPQARPRPGTRLHVPVAHVGRLEEIVEGSLRYVLGCTALEVTPGRRTIITDHRLLQLSWTRDAYYQALLLLAARDRDPRALDAVAEHLGWLWGSCERDHGRWMRSHLANGAIKDRAYQADQQLYPVLELLDHREAAGGWAAVPDGKPGWGELVDEVWRGLPVDPETGFVAAEENPADDPAGLPFQLSTQILLWRTAVRLAARSDQLGLPGPDLAGFATRLRRAVRQHFVVEGPLGPQWAYETDGAGRHRIYQDANDLPTALAPLWGFCAADCAEWATTMKVACSPANPAWYPGPLGGLGSLHTPGPWPLGDLQEWIAASLLGNQVRAAGVFAKLTQVAAPDGLLPETYDATSGAWAARHWFAWPSAALAALALGGAEGVGSAGG